MALTPTEEAQIRDLIAQKAAILSLAASESTIISKLGATKVNLSGLPVATSLSPTDIFLVRQGIDDKSVSASIVNTTIAGNSAKKTEVQASSYNYSVATGTANAITATFSPVPTLVDGMIFFVKTTNPNTDNVTFSPNGITPGPVRKAGSINLAPGDVTGEGHIIELTWDASNSQYFMRNPSNAVSLQSLNFPEVNTLTNTATVSVASLVGFGGTVTIAGNEFIVIGKEIVPGIAGINCTVKIPAFSKNLLANSTYYLRGNYNNTTDSFVVYVQQGTDIDSAPVSLKGTVDATSGGGFDSTLLDVLFAKIVTSANGTTPTLTNLKNKSKFNFRSIDPTSPTETRNTGTSGIFVHKRAVPVIINLGRLPGNYLQYALASRSGPATEVQNVIYNGTNSDSAGFLTGVTNRYIIDPVHTIDTNASGNQSFLVMLSTFYWD
jgi:hypothetical protein